MEKVDLVVIGTGESNRSLRCSCLILSVGIFGLATARTYTEAHPAAIVVVIEAADSLGGTWAKHRLYPGLKTNNIFGTYEFPDFPMTSEEFGVGPWQHIPGANLHHYLVQFAEHYGLTKRIRFNTRVEVVEQGDEDDWILTLQEKSASTAVKLRSSKLVIATGMTGNPNLPSLPGADQFGAPIFHAKDFLQHKDLLETASRVIVYGGAKSAWDAVYAYASSGVSVEWVIRESGRGPCWMTWPFVTPLTIWLEKIVFMRVLTWLTPCIWGARDGYHAIKSFFHESVVGQWIVSSFFGAVANDALAANKYDDHPETAKLKPWSDAFWSGTSLSMLNYPTDFFYHIRNGRVKIHHGDITHLSSHTAHLSSGQNLTADALHCSTGWKHEAPINVSPASLIPDLGLPHVADAAPSALSIKADKEILTRFPMLSNQPNVYPKRKNFRNPLVDAEVATTPFRLYRFMVPPKYIHKRNFAVAGAMLSLGQPISAQIQGLWITSYLDGTLDVSQSTEEVEYSTELFVRYSKWRTPGGCGGKHGDMIFETMPYWDQLLQDIGLPFKRKATWLQEIFMPYCVADYAGLVDQWIQLKQQGKLNGGCGSALGDKRNGKLE